MRPATSIGTRGAGVLAACLLFLAGCGQPETPPLRIGINPWPGYEFLYLAAQRGFFTDAGLAVDIVEFSSLGDSRRAYERGQLDGLASTLIELIEIASRTGTGPEIVLVTDYSDGADVIVASESIAGVADLRGKRVAAETGSLGTFMLSRALQQRGLSLRDIELISMDQTEIRGALATGQVQAAVTYPPVSIEVLRHPDMHVLFSSAEIPAEVVDVLALDPRLLRERPEIVPRLRAAWARALAFAAQSPALAHRVMAEREGVSPAEFSDALTGMHILGAEEQPRMFVENGPLDRALRATARVMRVVGARHADPSARIAVHRASGAGP